MLWTAGCTGTTATDGGPLARDAGPPEVLDAGPYVPPPPPPAEPGRHDVTVVDTRAVVPGPGLPSEAPPQSSNNNLDIIRHDGRVYLAWRTSADHFAGPETVIYVVSSADEMTWTFETEVSLETDVREPRFLSLNGSLFLYVARLGTNALSFDPMGVSVTERTPAGTWTAPEIIASLDGYIAWRTRTERGVPYMTAYFGGEHIYNGDGVPLHIDLLTTTDGRTWTGVDPAMPTIYTGGGSETDFVIADDGSLYGIIRNEAGDDTGWGSLVCHAPAGALADWTCAADPKKYDSPLMFWYDGEAYLIGRRNVTETGNYDLMTGIGGYAGQLATNQIAYRDEPKRCSLWRYVQGEDRIAYLMDLPSGGDTCFPAMIQGEAANELIIYNYSSPVDAPDIVERSWSDGQAGETRVYRHVLRFDPR